MKQSNTVQVDPLQLQSSKPDDDVIQIVPRPSLEKIAQDFSDKIEDGDEFELNGIKIIAKDGVPEGKILGISDEFELLNHEQLLKALYWVYDFMDRSLINFFLVGKTAEAVRAKKDLFGDKITVGVRRMEWESGSRRIADAFATPTKEEAGGNTVEYEYEGVPIILYVLEDDATIQGTDSQMYASEFFKLPNPYDEFLKVFDWIK